MHGILHYSFIVNALVTGSAVAIAAAGSGYFMVCRRMTFAGHALPNMGFAGAAGAVLLGVEPVYGLFAVTMAAALAMGLASRNLKDRDVGDRRHHDLHAGAGVPFPGAVFGVCPEGLRDSLRQHPGHQRAGRSRHRRDGGGLSPCPCAALSAAPLQHVRSRAGRGAGSAPAAHLRPFLGRPCAHRIPLGPGDGCAPAVHPDGRTRGNRNAPAQTPPRRNPRFPWSSA